MRRLPGLLRRPAPPACTQAPSLGVSRRVVQGLQLPGGPGPAERRQNLFKLADDTAGCARPRPRPRPRLCAPTDPRRAPPSRAVYINGEFIGGCDTTMEMFKSGELRQVLKEAGLKE